MKTMINENQRGLLFKNGVFKAYLQPGKYSKLRRNQEISIVSTRGAFDHDDYDLEIFLKHQALANDLDVIEVADETIALHFVNGRYDGYLSSGRHAFFNIYDKHEFQLLSTKEVEIDEAIPKYLLNLLPSDLVFKIEVSEHQKARLYFDKKFVRLLDAGTHYFWNNGTRVEAQLVDTRTQLMDITGQEIMTVDKVSLRINFVCNYRIRDYIKIHTEIEDYARQIHILLQLVLREYIGKYRLDEILENKNRISAYVLERLKEKEAALFVEFIDAGVKDIILPGEIRDIMNTVLYAEKKAHANVITRREEVASTRSLLNTAKLMDENQTLYKLKELETLEKICENVGNISVNGGADLLSQLTTLFQGNSK